LASGPKDLVKTGLLLLGFLALACHGLAATDVKVTFTLNTIDIYGAPLQESRYYYLYRPDNLSKTTPVPMVLVFEASPASGPATFFHRKADQAGFVLLSCSFSGNATGTPGTSWTNDDPRIVGYEDYDYISEVINQVRASNNANDAFTVGLSKGGHMSLAYACARPSTLKAASSLDEFMQADNIPSAPLPIIAFHGTLDANVPYAMLKDTVDIWRAADGLSDAQPVTTYESSPLIPNSVSMATWRGGIGGTQVAFVTIIGGTHAYPLPTTETGYDFTDDIWSFFSQYLTNPQGAPKIVAQPANNTQLSGQPASFWVTATGSGPFSYQWQRNGVDIPGATSSWYTTSPVAQADNGTTFRAAVSSGSASVTSASATLTVRAAPAGPTIATQPVDQAVIGGQPVSFTVAATGAAPLSYQWKKNGMNIAGATAPSFIMPAAITADSGASLMVVVTDGAGSVTSNRATLIVTSAAGAPIMITNPARARVLPGETASFWVSAWGASPMSYQWQKGTIDANMADIPGATGATYTTPATTLADQLTLFRCIVSNPAGSVTSTIEILFVTAAPTAPTQIGSPIDAFAEVGVPFRYTIASSGGTTPVTYSASPLPSWLSLDPASGLLSGTPSKTGATSITLSATNSAGHISRLLMLTVVEHRRRPGTL